MVRLETSPKTARRWRGGFIVAVLTVLTAANALAQLRDIERLTEIHTDFPPSYRTVFPDGQRVPVRLTITGEVLSAVPDGLFGQLLERVRADSPELGVEGAWSAEANDWQSGFIELVEELAPTVIRFPGGIEAERSDWRWGIDNAPGRLTAADLGPGRGRMAQEMNPGVFTTNRVGTEEFLALCRRVSAEPWLVVNMATYRDAPEVGAALAADWVEYCNAPNDGTNPHGGVDWAAVRAANGHPEPHGARLWELGNEVWSWPAFLSPEEYRDMLGPYVQAMLEVDPEIEFIGMGNTGDWARAALEGIGPRLRYLAGNCYTFWRVDRPSTTHSEIWEAGMSGLPQQSLQGLDEALAAIEESGRSGEVKLAVNEWNHNLFYGFQPPPSATRHLRMMGAAVILNELMRRGGDIELAAMSAMVANSWMISVIRVDPTGETPPGTLPYHALMSLVRRNHGSERLEIELADCPTLGPTVDVGNIDARPPFPVINAVATRSESTVYLQIINGAPTEPVTLAIEARTADAQADGLITRSEIYYPDSIWLEPPSEDAILATSEIEAQNGAVTVELPPHSFTVFAWPRSEIGGI